MIQEIQIDDTTLPSDGQQVRWQTQHDIDIDNWKEGIFDKENGLFLVGFKASYSEWDDIWSVHHWDAITKRVPSYVIYYSSDGVNTEAIAVNVYNEEDLTENIHDLIKKGYSKFDIREFKQT